MYKSLSQLERNHIQLCLQARSLAEPAIDSLINVVNISAQFQDRPTFEIFEEIEEERRAMELLHPPLTPAATSQEALRFLIDSIPSESTRIYNAYDVLYGDAPVSANLQRMKLKFWNSQVYRDTFMAERGLPLGLTPEAAQDHIRLFGVE